MNKWKLNQWSIESFDAIVINILILIKKLLS